MHHFLGCTGVHVFEAVLQCIEFLSRNQVRLADKDLVSKTDLSARFLAVIKLLGSVLGILPSILPQQLGHCLQHGGQLLHAHRQVRPASRLPLPLPLLCPLQLPIGLGLGV